MISKEKINGNSFYPLYGRDTFLFESVKLAEEITKKGREILNKMEKQIYIVVANVEFLIDKGFYKNFLKGTDEEVIAFCDDNYDREDCDLGVYPLDTFLQELNDDRIDVDSSFFRRIMK